MTNAFTEYTGGNDDLLAKALFVSPSGISYVNGSAKYTGRPQSSSFFDNLNLGQAVVSNKGILLTSGDGSPAFINTSSSYTLSTGENGDTQLNTEVQNAFPGAGSTRDASILEFQIMAAAGVKSVSFEVVFGSDEYPEFSSSTFVDIAAIFVNGKNVALFGGNADSPLSVLDNNVAYFQDNTGGGITIEYDGLSKKLKVIAEVKPGVNDIKIAIADTGDSLYDSGIFVSNIKGSSLSLTGIVNEVLGTEGKDTLKALKNADNILFGSAGKDKLIANNGFDILFGDQDGTDTGLLAISISRDKFVFAKKSSSSKKLKDADVIGDWDKKDKIDISKLSKTKFDFIGKKKFHDDGDPEVRYKTKAKKDFTAVYVDKNGDGKTDLAIKLDGIHTLHDNDFVL